MTSVDAMLIVIVLSLLAYALLAGADFGGGFWDLAAGRGAQRRRGPDGPGAVDRAVDRAADRGVDRAVDPDGQRALIAASLGPVWEANHVWLIFVIVSVFSAFPAAFGTIAVALELPLGLALVGIVLRGAAYVYRAYGDGAALPDRWWGRIFAGASILTPFMLGVSGAALATGGLGPRSGPLEPFRSALTLTAGVLAVAATAFLAAVYLCHNAAQSPETAHLVRVFRRKAMGAGAAAGAVALAMLPFLYRDAPIVAARFTGRSLPFAALSALCGIGSLLVLRREQYVLARFTAGLAVAGVLGGWAAAQYPDLMTGAYTAAQAAAAPQSMDAMLVAMSVGMTVVLPSFYLLLKVFSRPAVAEH
ncbi:cytochrome d ubiquinol oxidase subunit II [Actinocrinis puniceicyclus]|uniref:Cytochrome d ubiquinol oxidase subunit II n=1 Tax=Actinocrinis puniceicyclus TaxID=977794 RepID=A0A8J8BCY5_9ACTN|nr:cytochrome d ubiquinol oxidase subunit II [Actinocrinis puniceicyclus]MBS2965617.1 cytochrome d ubiquinol oxidase subunit II [Actinocrinis puniceicyclus]